MKEILTEYIRATLLMAKDRDMEHFSGTMVKNFKVTGKQELRRDSEYGSLQKAIIMKENGIIIDNKDRVYLDTKIALIKDNL